MGDRVVAVDLGETQILSAMFDNGKTLCTVGGKSNQFDATGIKFGLMVNHQSSIRKGLGGIAKSTKKNLVR